MTFIDESVDVYVSTWDKTSYDNHILGINETHEITEEFIRGLLPDATILIESLDCFKSQRYSDRMIYRWLAGWQMIKNSGKHYDKILVIRPDLFFEPNQHRDSFSLSTDDVFEIVWLHSLESLQDCAFAASPTIIDRLFSGISVEDWQTSENVDIHRWWANAVSKNVKCEIRWLFKENPFIFFRPSVNGKKSTLFDIILRHNDWRDSFIIRDEPNEFRGPLRSWGPQPVEDAVLAYRSNRLDRPPTNKTLVIFSGICRNTQSASVCLPIWGEADVAVVSWDSFATHQFAHRVRANHLKLVNEGDLATALRNKFGEDLNTMLNPSFARMTYLWQHCYRLFNSSDYERIVILRPDAFYWAGTTPVDMSLLDGFHTMGCLSTAGNKFFQDVLMVFDRSKWFLLDGIFNECMTITKQMPAGVAVDTHKTLHEIFTRDGRTHGSDALTSMVKDVVIQRDTFKYQISDQYGYDYYKAVFFDSAAWWRRQNGLPYGGFLRQPD